MSILAPLFTTRHQALKAAFAKSLKSKVARLKCGQRNCGNCGESIKTTFRKDFAVAIVCGKLVEKIGSDRY
ncbi:MAG: hypothetical protein LH660_09420 [Phormidesmis sp. CAN_BIN36]|nr:hypothetical protein [Phormidesmis sp. CAN_BIN36]